VVVLSNDSTEIAQNTTRKSYSKPYLGHILLPSLTSEIIRTTVSGFQHRCPACRPMASKINIPLNACFGCLTQDEQNRNGDVPGPLRDEFLSSIRRNELEMCSRKLALVQSHAKTGRYCVGTNAIRKYIENCTRSETTRNMKSERRSADAQYLQERISMRIISSPKETSNTAEDHDDRAVAAIP
jgi:hypothetical protein